MNIKILGVGCARCTKLEKQVRELVSENKITCSIEKITDVQEMLKYGIMATPGLVINEKLYSSGNLPDKNQVIIWINENLNS